MFDRRSALVLLAAGAACGAVAPAFAASSRPFDASTFDAALAAGKPIVVHVSAPWCPICRAQKPILSKLLDEPRFAGFAAFEVDFDNDKASVRAVGARLQSTLIAYNGGREIARTVGDREEGWIEELLEKALAAGS